MEQDGYRSRFVTSPVIFSVVVLSKSHNAIAGAREGLSSMPPSSEMQASENTDDCGASGDEVQEIFGHHVAQGMLKLGQE